MKKLLFILVVLMALFTFVSCNDSALTSTDVESSSSEKTTYVETTQKDTTYTTSDEESSTYEETLSETTETVKATTTTKSIQTTKATEAVKTTKKHTTTTTYKKASMTVYRTPYGKRYHRLSTCGGKNSYAISIDDVGSLTPCQKCW